MSLLSKTWIFWRKKNFLAVLYCVTQRKTMSNFITLDIFRCTLDRFSKRTSSNLFCFSLINKQNSFMLEIFDRSYLEFWIVQTHTPQSTADKISEFWYGHAQHKIIKSKEKCKSQRLSSHLFTKIMWQTEQYE